MWTSLTLVPDVPQKKKGKKNLILLTGGTFGTRKLMGSSRVGTESHPGNLLWSSRAVWLGQARWHLRASEILTDGETNVPPQQAVVRGRGLLPWHRGRSWVTLLRGRMQATRKTSHLQQLRAARAYAHGGNSMADSLVAFSQVYVCKAEHPSPRVWESTFP